MDYEINDGGINFLKIGIALSIGSILVILIFMSVVILKLNSIQSEIDNNTERLFMEIQQCKPAT